MKKYILLIDSSNDKLEEFSNAIAQKETTDSYDCLLVRNSDMAVKVLSRIIPDLIFINIGAPNICLHTCLSRIHQLEILYGMPVYLFGSADVRDNIKTIYRTQIGKYIRNDFNAEFLTRLFQGDFLIEGTVNVICSN